MKQTPVVILCIAVCILFLFPAAAMDAGPITTSQGGAEVTSVIIPGGNAEPHSVTANPTQVIRPPLPSVPAPLQGSISGIPILMIAGFVMIVLALFGFGYWYIFRK
jgi:hypothetical protein